MKIKKDNHIIKVSPDAYKSMYKRLGYQEAKSIVIAKDSEEIEENEIKNTKIKNNTDNK